jgi:chromosomal replication initiator protein
VKNVKRKFLSITFKKQFEYFQLDLEILQSKVERHVVHRTIGYVFAKNSHFLGKYRFQIGDRDHATVLHACKTVDNLVATDKQFKKFVEDIHKKINAIKHHA